MIFLEGSARPLLVAHAVLAALLVGAATHHALWCRRYLRGDFARAATERRTATIVAASFIASLALGNLIYPAYRVRVRAELFDTPSAGTAAAELRRESADRLGHAPPPATPRDLAWVGRLFDIKEHWVALGGCAALALLVLARAAHPSIDPRTATLYVAVSWFACATAWVGALIGIVVASYRSVGS